MEILKSIRLRIGNSLLHSRSASIRRLKQSFDFKKVSRIGVIWDSSNENDLKIVAAFNRQMSEAGKTVEVLTWVPAKTVSDRLTGLAYMKFVRKSDLSWTFMPKSEDALNFISTKFDLLIDINPNSVFPMKVIAALSPSPMKVGPDVKGEAQDSPYDLMIQAGHPFDTSVFIEQVLIYLSMISSPETRA